MPAQQPQYQGGKPRHFFCGFYLAYTQGQLDQQLLSNWMQFLTATLGPAEHFLCKSRDCYIDKKKEHGPLDYFRIFSSPKCWQPDWYLSPSETQAGKIRVIHVSFDVFQYLQYFISSEGEISYYGIPWPYPGHYEHVNSLVAFGKSMEESSFRIIGEVQSIDSKDLDLNTSSVTLSYIIRTFKAWPNVIMPDYEDSCEKYM